MAADWIKVEIDTPHKPEVLKLSRILGIHKAQAFGLVVMFWGWCDKQTIDGKITGVTEDDIDILLSQPGFSKAMQEVAWMQYDPKAQEVLVPKFDIHNSQSAKKRAQASHRQAKWRSGSQAQPTHKGNGAAKPEPERVELPEWLNAETWSAWAAIRPAKARTKDAMKAALAKLEKLRAAGHDANAIVSESLANGWQGLFPPDQKRGQVKPAQSDRPSIKCATCGERAYLWTGHQCDRCWRKGQGFSERSA